MWKTKGIKLQAGVHFRDALEHFHLIDMYFDLHKQLIGFMRTTEIAGPCLMLIVCPCDV